MKTKATGVKLTNNGTAITDGAACKSGTTYVGNTFTLVATPIPADSDEKTVTWSSSNASVATVDENGKISVKATGTTTITAKIGTVSTTCKIDSVSQASSGSGSSNCIYLTQQACVDDNNHNCYKSGNCWIEMDDGYNGTSLSKCESNLSGVICPNGKTAKCFKGANDNDYFPKCISTCSKEHCEICYDNKCSKCEPGYKLSWGSCVKPSSSGNSSKPKPSGAGSSKPIPK